MFTLFNTSVTEFRKQRREPIQFAGEKKNKERKAAENENTMKFNGENNFRLT